MADAAGAMRSFAEIMEDLMLVHSQEVDTLKATILQLRQSLVSDGGGHQQAASQDELPRCLLKAAETKDEPVQAAILRSTAVFDPVRVDGSTSLQANRQLLSTAPETPEHAFVNGPFDAFVVVCITLNTVVMLISLHLEGSRANAILEDYEFAEDVWLMDMLEASDHIFNAIYAIELVLRLYFFRCEYFVSGSHIHYFNACDAGFVVFSALSSLTSQTATFGFMRSLRIMRIIRALRIARFLKSFSSLRVLVETIAVSFMALFWSMVLLGVVTLMGAIILCQFLQPSLSDEAVDIDLRLWCFNYYGTPARALYTVFEITFSGCWPTYARKLIEELSPWYAVFFVVYVFVVVFAMTRVVTALFLKDTLAVANKDWNRGIGDKLQEKNFYAKKLLEFFALADTSNDGLVSLSEFQQLVQKPQAKAFLSLLELDVHESESLFQMLSDGGRDISPAEFVKGALQLKGHARSQDVIAVLHQLRHNNRRVESLIQRFEDGSTRAHWKGDERVQDELLTDVEVERL